MFTMQFLWCNVWGAIFECNVCEAMFAMQCFWCNICNTMFKVYFSKQCWLKILKFNLTLAANIQSLLSVFFAHKDFLACNIDLEISDCNYNANITCKHPMLILSIFAHKDFLACNIEACVTVNHNYIANNAWKRPTPTLSIFWTKRLSCVQ